MKSGSTLGRRSNATPRFRMVYPEKGGRKVTSALFFLRECENRDLEQSRSTLKIFWSLKQITSRFRRRVDEIFLETRLPDASAILANIETAKITDVTVLQMGHCADHQRTRAQQTESLSTAGTRQCEANCYSSH